MKRLKIYLLFAVGSLLLLNSCSKNTNTSDSYYTPTAANVTPNATLAELQQGRDLYLGKCGACHQIYSPDSFNASNWQNILSMMAPRAGLSSANSTLVYKYVTRGK
jgi:PBP1b-binding outer membrane lipoprotein LpoB